MKDKIDEDVDEYATRIESDIEERTKQLELLMAAACTKDEEISYAVKINGLRSLLFLRQ